ncbi:MAG: polysaccharide ABC transporter ATP-binding protein [Cyclobacteriaceae bacterium]|nr:ATP-binding cassette domain-containing protein [Flammeovirgaceae bacterium]MCO5272575.1 polysaccharide ABC transporter ATP-binding protein [Cyclobacteriaceae bacterium]
MSKTVIQVEHLSKAYRIGAAEKKSDTIAGALWNAIKSPVTNFQQLRNLRALGQDEATVFWALKDINFEVKEGEVLGIIGHNGAGKSTLLKILSRITEPTEGRVTIHGRVSSLLEVGTGFHPDLTGRENIYMNGTILGMRKKEIDAKLEEIIAFSGINKYIDTPVKRYSSGMTVRLAFSVAAHLEPEILIIDEVLAVGDAEFQNKCLGKMEDVAKLGRTVLFVSHNLGFVSSLCNKGLLLKAGEITFSGGVRDCINKYSLFKSTETSYQVEDIADAKTYIKEIKIETSEANGIQLVNKPFRISFLIETNSKLIDPAISFQIVNNYNVPAIHILNLNSEIQFCQEPGETTLVCKIENLRLYPGHYSIMVNFNQGIGRKGSVPLKNICPFEVVRNQSRNLYWQENAAMYLEDHIWEVY